MRDENPSSDPLHSLVELGEDPVAGVDDLLARVAPGMVPRLGIEERFGPYMVGFMLGAVAVGGVLEASGGTAGGLATALLLAMALVITVVVGEGASRLSHRAGLARHRRWLRDRPDEVQGRLADLLRTRIERRREELLGPGSDWARARDPVDTAAHEAGASLAYWRERAAQDADDPTVTAHLATAERLAEKLERARDSLDRRSTALREFFDRCNAKLAVLERSRRDLAESRRLTGLAQEADVTVERAHGALEGIAMRFVDDARQVAVALAGLDRTLLLDQAAQGPVEAVEEVADRILASEVEAERALGRLTSGLDRLPSSAAP